MIYHVKHDQLDSPVNRERLARGDDVMSSKIWLATYRAVKAKRPHSHFRDMRSLYGKWEGKTVFLCGSGPSLDNVPEKLPGTTVAINRSIIKIKADYWSFMDKEVVQRHGEHPNAQAAEKWIAAGMHLFFPDSSAYLIEAEGTPMRYPDPETRPLYWNLSTFSATFHLCLRMKPKRLVLCGTDLSTDGYFGEDKTPGISGKGLRHELTETLRRMDEMFGEDRPQWEGDLNGVEVLDTSYGGMPFEKRELEKILAETGA